MPQTMYRTVLAISAIVVLGGCVSIPAPLEGEFSGLTPDRADESSVGTPVRWGGTVISTKPGRERTCIEVLARELARNHRPETGDHNHGRFLACRPGFTDPAQFSEGREITVTGRLEGFREDTIGEYVYTYPVVDAEVVHLWPERPDEVRYYPHYDPWYHRWPYWGPYWRPHWYLSGTVVIDD